MFLKWIRGSQTWGTLKCAWSVASMQGCHTPCSSYRPVYKPWMTPQLVQWREADANGWDLSSIVLSLHLGILLPLQTCTDCGGQRLCLSLRGFGRKVCDVFSSRNRFSWYSQTASLPSFIVTCIGVSSALGRFSDFFFYSCAFPFHW